jgi:hypothetical protein
MNNEFHQSDPRPPATRRIGWNAWILIPAILGAVIGAGVAAPQNDERICMTPPRWAEALTRSVRASVSHQEPEG